MSHHPDLTTSVIKALGWLYLILFSMNAAWTFRSYSRKDDVRITGVWGIITALLGMFSIAHITGGSDPDRFLIRMPEFVKSFIDLGADPVTYFCGSTLVFIAMIVLRKWWTQPTVAWILLNLSILFLALSMTDYDFRQIVGKPDNVPIVSMLFIVGFFTWLFFRRAVDNDDRIAAGKPLYEVDNGGQEKVLVWPDLVYTELICMVVVSAVLIAWGVALQAPLEEPAAASRTPNPSKAPWYFLGLQEMLVYYDPWMAGVVLPTVILGGLMALPYIDFNKKGNGYFTFNERKFAICTFMFGFLPLWISLIILGTFLRGPNWNFFGIYEPWDAHKLQVLNNVNLSEYFWLDWMTRLQVFEPGLPIAPAGADFVDQVIAIVKREGFGLLLVLGYLFALPPVMATTIFRGMFMRMGFLRYMVFSNLVLFMACLPIKMVLRWAFNLKYIVAIPEWFFNI